jgi:putative Mg2+ transporter-C (MgtC) family protein
MGLCYGGGQLGLGLAAFGLGLAVLVGLKQFELRMRQEHSATLRVFVTDNGPGSEEIESLLKREGISLSNPIFSFEGITAANRMFGWKLHWRGEREEVNAPRVVETLASRPDIQRLEFIE